MVKYKIISFPSATDVEDALNRIGIEKILETQFSTTNENGETRYSVLIKYKYL